MLKSRPVMPLAETGRLFVCRLAVRLRRNTYTAG
nr:MAG TPA: hypothetical protein [Caudoviricetes sp.]